MTTISSKLKRAKQNFKTKPFNNKLLFSFINVMEIRANCRMTPFKNPGHDKFYLEINIALNLDYYFPFE